MLDSFKTDDLRKTNLSGRTQGINFIMETKINEILAKAENSLPLAKTKSDVASIGAEITGPNGTLTALMKIIPTLDKAQRPIAGKLINQAKQKIEPMIAAAYARIENEEMAAALGPKPDITLPNIDAPFTRLLSQSAGYAIFLSARDLQ